MRERERDNLPKTFYSISKTLWENSSKLKRNRLIFNSIVLKLSDYSYSTFVKAIQAGQREMGHRLLWFCITNKS